MALVARRLLIVDDDPRFRELARMLLEDAREFEVIGEAPDGGAALTAARELGPDVVLLDVNLPDVIGFELAARLAAEAGDADVVMISSRDDEDGYGRLAAEAGAAGFLPKHDFSASAISRILR
jgi:DNA-binding NarL/FixJ family response regulator